MLQVFLDHSDVGKNYVKQYRCDFFLTYRREVLVLTREEEDDRMKTRHVDSTTDTGERTQTTMGTVTGELKEGAQQWVQ